jgi:hypothetical protein
MPPKKSTKKQAKAEDSNSESEAGSPVKKAPKKKVAAKKPKDDSKPKRPINGEILQ